MMASAKTVLPGPNGKNITGKIEDGQVYISLNDMAQDAGKSLHEYGLPETTKHCIGTLTSQEGIPPHEYSQAFKALQETGGELWAPEPLARHFGEWLAPQYWGLVNSLRMKLRTLEKHTDHDVQVEQVKKQYGNTSGADRDKEVAQLHAKICHVKTGRTPDEWKAFGEEKGLPSQERKSGLAVIRNFLPARAAEISYMHSLLSLPSFSFDAAEEKSRAERPFFEAYCRHDGHGC
jgi:hypothetical protein